VAFKEECLQVARYFDTTEKYLDDIVHLLVIDKDVSAAFQVFDQLQLGLNYGTPEDNPFKEVLTTEESSYIQKEISDMIHNFIKAEATTPKSELQQNINDLDRQLPSEFRGLSKPEDIRPGGLSTIMKQTELDKYIDILKYTKVCACNNTPAKPEKRNSK